MPGRHSQASFCLLLLPSLSSAHRVACEVFATGLRGSRYSTPYNQPILPAPKCVRKLASFFAFLSLASKQALFCSRLDYFFPFPLGGSKLFSFLFPPGWGWFCLDADPVDAAGKKLWRTNVSRKGQGRTLEERRAGQQPEEGKVKTIHPRQG